MTMKDEHLFNKEFADIDPIDNSNHVQLPPKRKHQQSVLNRRQAAEESIENDPNYLADGDIELIKPHDFLEYKNPGIQEGVYRKLRLGKYPIEATLDLHRLTIREARIRIWDFLKQCESQSYRTIIITHGKGEQSNPPAKMKSYTAHWLQQHNSVLAFHTTQPQHGSYGAVYVLLKKSEQQKQQTREKFKR